MHYSVKVPDTKDRASKEASLEVAKLIEVMLDYGYTRLVSNGYEVKLDNEAIRRQKEYRIKRTEREAQEKKAKK